VATWSAVLSAFHVLALAIGLPAVFLRGRALKGPLDKAGVGRVIAADNVWAFAAFLWLTSGLMRAFGGFEKGADYYLHNRLFHAKLGLFALILLLELMPMITLMRWRIARARGEMPDTAPARTMSTLNHIELAVVVGMVFVAAFMARGFGTR
jgi:putative membrane protein